MGGRTGQRVGGMVGMLALIWAVGLPQTCMHNVVSTDPRNPNCAGYSRDPPACLFRRTLGLRPEYS